jgi:hypothetical protein
MLCLYTAPRPHRFDRDQQDFVNPARLDCCSPLVFEIPGQICDPTFRVVGNCELSARIAFKYLVFSKISGIEKRGKLTAEWAIRGVHFSHENLSRQRNRTNAK